MTKYKTTKKEILSNEYIVLSFGYCDIQNIERYLRPILYTSGSYGWCCDGYRLKNGWLVTTGYNPVEKITLYNEENFEPALNKERLEELAKLKADILEEVAKLKADIKDLEKRINTLDHEEAKKEVEKFFVRY